MEARSLSAAPRTFAPEFERLLAKLTPEMVEKLRCSAKPTLFEKKTCVHGHRITADNVLVNRSVSTPVRCLACHREAKRVYRARTRKNGIVSKQKVRNVLDALHEGKTLIEIFGRSRRVKSSQMVDPLAFINFKKRNRQIGKVIDELAAKNRRAANIRFRIEASSSVLRNDGADAYTAVVRATCGLADAIRDDVRADMLLALAEGRLRLREIGSRVAEFVRAHNRRFTHYAPSGGFMLSLDQPAFADTTTTIGERVTENLWGGGICA